MTLRLKRRASKIFSMSEGRKSQVILLDDRRLDIIIQPKLYSNDLLDLVASHFKLREKHYFGLGFVDETYHFNWLQGEKRVLDHDFPKKTGLLVLHFAIRFYVETIGLLRDTQTVELFYLNARQAIFRNQIECDVNTVFELAAHVLQASNGDFVSDEETKEELKKLPVIPTSTLKAHPSIAFCEEQVIEHYIRLTGTSRGLAIVNYMTIVEQLPTYGIHYYDVKDKKDIPWWLGISPKGIAVYDKNDKTTPRKLFTWKDLENLYYRDKKFSIEVHGPKREDTGSQVSVSRRTFGASNVDVHAWFASTNQLTKCIWSMAVAQHQFYLDRKQSKSQLPTARSMSEIAADLCRSTTSLPGSLGSDLSRSPSSHSLPSLSNSRYDLTIEQSDSLKAERDMYAALLARREALEDALKKKLEELKAVCLQEGELTGDLPPELPLARGEQPPVFRRRVGTAFSLSVNKVQGTDQLSSELSQLELEVELQGKITSAAQRLASDKTVSKFVRKQRKQSYIKAASKLKEMECKLNDMRKQVNDMRKQVVKEMPPHTSCLSSSTTPTSNRIYQGMYNVSDVQSCVTSHSSDELCDDASTNIHDISTATVTDGDLAALETITAKNLLGNMPHRFQKRGTKLKQKADDEESVRSNDSGVNSAATIPGTSSSSSSSSTSLAGPFTKHSSSGMGMEKPPSNQSLASSSSLSSSGYSYNNTTSRCRCSSSNSTGTLVGRRLASMPCYHDDQCLFPEDCASLDEATSLKDDASSGFGSLNLRDSPEKVVPLNSQIGVDKSRTISVSTDEDFSERSEGGRTTKHFVVSRGPQRSRFREIQQVVCQRQIINRKPESPMASVARLDSEFDLSIMTTNEISNSDNLDNSYSRKNSSDYNGACSAVWDDEDDNSRGDCSSSFGDDLSFGGGAYGGDSEALEDYHLWREEQNFTTRVQRRKQTVILSRSLRRHGPDIIERGYKAFENIYMGDVGPKSCVSSKGSVSGYSTVSGPICTGRGRTMSRGNGRFVEQPSQESERNNNLYSSGNTLVENNSSAVLNEKIQELIDSCGGDDGRSGRRSRSFDASHDMRVSNGVDCVRPPSDKVNHTLDDIKLDRRKLPTSSTSSTMSVGKKTSALFTKLRDRHKQMKAGSNDKQDGDNDISNSNFHSGLLACGGRRPNAYESNFAIVAGNIQAAGKTGDDGVFSNSSLAHSQSVCLSALSGRTKSRLSCLQASPSTPMIGCINNLSLPSVSHGHSISFESDVYNSPRTSSASTTRNSSSSSGSDGGYTTPTVYNNRSSSDNEFGNRPAASGPNYSSRVPQETAV